jgi:hypothetical protein
LPVVEQNQLVGIVTRGDLRGAQPSQVTSLSIFELNYLIGRVTLNQLMTRQPVTVTDDHHDCRCRPPDAPYEDFRLAGCQGRPPNRHHHRVGYLPAGGAHWSEQPEAVSA